jgi:pimeloyl-ACP methyl ester carboxylesterase
VTEFIDRDGVKLAFDREGHGRGDPIIFVHGWSCDRTYFAPQFAYFSATHPVATLDLRGHGESSSPAPERGAYTIPQFAADVAAVAGEGCGWRRPIVIGHSLGAIIAIAVAAHGGATAAVMVDSSPLSPTGATRELFQDAVQACARDTDGSWRAQFANEMFLATDRVRRDEILSGMSSGPADIAAACIQAIVDFDGMAALCSCRVPALLIGSALQSNPSDLLRAAKPDIVIGQTVGAGHFNQLEVPEQVNAMIERFLALSVTA